MSARPRELLRRAAPIMRASVSELAELTWPTRCAVCDAFGYHVCPDCAAALPYIDLWQACPRCGAPFGRLVCTECNSFALSDTGRAYFPFDECVSAVVFDEAVKRIVSVRKDAGDRALAHFMAACIVRVIPPYWAEEDLTVVPVPSTRRALVKRGFDHADELASCVASYMQSRKLQVLSVGKTSDQRQLGRGLRFANMARSMHATQSVGGRTILLVDDVLTTGATVCAATDALLDAGARCVHVTTFARVY